MYLPPPTRIHPEPCSKECPQVWEAFKVYLWTHVAGDGVIAILATAAFLMVLQHVTEGMIVGGRGGFYYHQRRPTKHV